MNRSVWIGWEPREAAAFAVARSSLFYRLPTRVMPVFGLIQDDLRAGGVYTRPEEWKENGQRWDVISDAPMATEFACSRFLVPHLAREKSQTAPGWAVFMDCDMLIRADINRLFEECDRNAGKAVMVVKHNHNPSETVKMDGQMQTRYSRKNWSSVCAFNLQHPSNDALTVDLVNSVPGRDLHGFCWLSDDEIGELDPKWNYLVGHSKPCPDPAIVHFTDGIPPMPGYENCEYADEWRRELSRWAA